MAGVIALTAGGLGGGVIMVLGVVARQVRREDRLYSLGEDAGQRAGDVRAGATVSVVGTCTRRSARQKGVLLRCSRLH